VVDPTKTYALISVSDTGSGMTGDEVENIFKAYFSTKGENGTGLGLSVVSTIVRGLGGAVAVTSKPGEGAVFEVYYPISTEQSDVIPRPETKTTDGNLTGRLILICDDNLGVAETHAAILESAGAETAVVDDPRDALEALIEDPEAWNALLTDFDMPHLNGAELAKAAREARADLPVVLCTAYDLHRRASATFAAEIEKPAEPTALILTLAAAIKATTGNRSSDRK